MTERALGRNETLSLRNSGELSLFFVGSGSAFASTLYQNNIVVIKGEDHLMVDAGTKASMALRSYGLPITAIDNFFITHSHADHIGGLEEVMLMGRYVKRQRPRIIITPRYEKLLWGESLKGGGAYNESHGGKPLGFSDLWEVVRPSPVRKGQRDLHEIQFGSINVKFFRTNHFPEQAESWSRAAWSTGLILDDSVLFTGDTKFDPEMVDWICSNWEIQTIFHDAQLFTGGIHASVEELAGLPDPCRSRMYLMHYGDGWHQREEEIRTRGFLGFAKQGHFYSAESRTS